MRWLLVVCQRMGWTWDALLAAPDSVAREAVQLVRDQLTAEQEASRR